LRRFQNRWLTSLIYKDPLGIGVLLGYLALRTVETSNIMWIAQGIQLRLSQAAIWSEVELVT
jgi:vacuolar-type H+-ATPase subunit C/Vma6